MFASIFFGNSQCLLAFGLCWMSAFPDIDEVLSIKNEQVILEARSTDIKQLDSILMCDCLVITSAKSS